MLNEMKSRIFLEKKQLLFAILLLSISSLFSITTTKTITDPSALSTIQDACNNNLIIRNYYEIAFGNRDLFEPYTDETGRAQTWQSSNYANRSLVGAMGPVVGYVATQAIADAHLYEVHHFLLRPSVVDDFLDVAGEVIPSITRPQCDSLLNYPDFPYVSACGKSHMSSYILENMAFMVDMLWWFDGFDTNLFPTQTEYQAALAEKLDSYANFIQRRLHFTRGRGLEADTTEVEIIAHYNLPWSKIEWPSYNHNNYRLTALGALGYAAVVLGAGYGEVTLNDYNGNPIHYDSYLDFVDYELDEVDGEILCINTFSTGHIGEEGLVYINGPGYINHNLHNSGLYTEGISYMSQIMDGMSLYFTARNRYDGKNYYDIFADQMLEETIPLITPDFGYVCFDDTYYYNSSGNMIFPVGYYQLYQQDFNNMELDNSINWYTDNYFTESGMNYLVPAWNGEGALQSILSYSGRSLSGGTIPNVISQGSYSNNDYSVLRSEMSSLNEFKDQSAMWITHNEGLSYSSHEQGDQSSFVLWYKGRQLITDPGYFSVYADNHNWCNSSFAHNVIQVENTSSGSPYNLVYDFEDPPTNFNDDIVGKIEPIGMHNIKEDPANKTQNPVHKCYHYEVNYVSVLKINLKYYNHHVAANIGSETIDLFRHYYRIGEDVYLIYDDMQRLESEPEEIDMANQLHFEAYNNLDQNLTSYQNGRFELTNSSTNVNLFGTMGSLHNPEAGFPQIKENLPFGQYRNNGSNDYAHRAIRLKTVTNENEKFLTLLVPSENDTTPIDDISPGSGQYVAKYSLNTGYNCYAAVSDGNDVYCDNGNTRFVTDASFLLIEANSIFTNLKKLILNSDNFLEVRDMSGTDFTNVIVFDSDHNFEEMLASYEEDSLVVTFKTEWNDHPKYKILRCGVEPENFNATSYFDTYLNGTQPNQRYYFEHVQSLAYDENYFYVNYDYDELATENLLTEELTIYQGVFDGITIQGVTQFGTGDIVLKNEIPVPFGTNIVFLPSSQPQLYSNFHLIVDGDLTALGTAENNIIFDKYSSTNWNKIEITNDGNANMKFCKFLNAQFPLYNNGYVDIEYCEFLDNSGGIYLDNPTGYQINHSIINNCGYGILIKDSHILMHRSAIKNNLITNNNYGLWFYNASGYVEADTIFANKYAGIMANRGSNPVIVGSSISSTYYNSNNYPEIKISGSSYPIVDRNENDIIFGNGHSIYNMDIEPRDYRCSENWWGTTNELAISNSFYPLNWLIDFTPISQSPNVGYNPWSGGSLFEEGLLAESNGDLITAKTKYTQSIEENPESIEALWSVSRLINCSETEMEYADLLQYYNQLQIDYTETELADAAKLDEVFCNRLLGNYQDAITEYEFLLDENLTFIDSVFTQLDIVYTYIEASSGGNRANVTFQNSNNSLISVKQAKEREVELWGLLENQITDGGIYSPEISKSILHRNYPNPFNPSTTISFSIPEQSKIQIMIYNIKGQKVKTVTNESFDKGIHSVVWNGVDDSGRNVSSGVYFYNLSVNGKSKAIKKCLLLK
jgi:tetratricopeptide (TPR) repeat protein